MPEWRPLLHRAAHRKSALISTVLRTIGGTACDRRCC